MRLSCQPFGAPSELLVVAGDQDVHGLRVVLRELVRRVVRECLRRVTVDLGVVHAQQVVLPHQILGGLADPLGDGVASGDRVGVAVLRPQVVGQDGPQPLRVPRVDAGRVPVDRVGDVEAVLQQLLRVRGRAHERTAVQTLFTVVISSIEVAPRVRPWPDNFTPP